MAAVAITQLLQRVRSGDPAAAEELVRTYEPELRRAIRVRLHSTLGYVSPEQFEQQS